MKTVSVTRAMVTVIILATAPYANAIKLAPAEINAVRGVLRNLNIDEKSLSNEQKATLHNHAPQIHKYETIKVNDTDRDEDGSVFTRRAPPSRYRTCLEYFGARFKY